MATLIIQMDRGKGWETRSAGEFSGSVDDIAAALPAYAVQYPHRALLDGRIIAEVAPTGRKG